MAEKDRVPLSIIMPAYNEAEGIEDAVIEAFHAVIDQIPGSECVVVDDGSTDRTGDILDELAQRDGRLRVLHKPNGGHGPALRSGIELARGNYVFLVDSDRQIPMTAFTELWQAAQDRDGAFGIRTKREDRLLRLALTRLLRASLRLLFGADVRDANAPFKILRRGLWHEVDPLIPPDTLVPSIFLSVCSNALEWDVVQTPVPHRRRSTGEVSIRGWKLFKFSLRAFRQLLAFRRCLQRAIRRVQKVEPRTEHHRD